MRLVLLFLVVINFLTISEIIEIKE